MEGVGEHVSLLAIIPQVQVNVQQMMDVFGEKRAVGVLNNNLKHVIIILIREQRLIV
jgi:hypothetical protein